MAPVTYDIPATQTTTSQKPAVSLDIFPDGLKTTGQQPPLYDQIRPFSEFPKKITGPTVWKAEDYKNNPEKWTHRFTEEECAEMSAAADAFVASGIPLTAISKVRYSHLPFVWSFIFYEG